MIAFGYDSVLPANGVCQLASSGHQVFAAKRAEYGDIVVLVEDAQGAEDFVDC